jgi:hypothetical protein
MGRREVELADCIKILDRYFEQQFGKGSNFYKQAWLPVKRASKPVELSTTAPNSAIDAIALLREIVDRYGVDESSCWLGGFVKRAAAIVQQRTLP